MFDSQASNVLRRQQGWTLALLALLYSGLTASQPALPQAHGSQGSNLGREPRRAIETH